MSFAHKIDADLTQLDKDGEAYHLGIDGDEYVVLAHGPGWLQVEHTQTGEPFRGQGRLLLDTSKIGRLVIYYG